MAKLDVTCTSSFCCFFFYKIRLHFDLYRYFLAIFNKTIIPLSLVGYEMIIANSALRASLAIYME